MRIDWLRFPSLELDWMPLSSRKGSTTPRICLSDDDSCGGAYWAKTQERRHPALNGNLIDVDLSEGAVIVLCITKTAGTLAHEYRHHLQAERGLIPAGNHGWFVGAGETYKDAIIRYFRTQWWEMDALLFENRHGQSDVSAEWMEWIAR